MITREEIMGFAEFCYDNYNIKIPPAVIETFIKTKISLNENGSNVLYNDSSHYKVKECNSGNIGCSHITFDSARCDNCEYSTEPSP